MTKSYFVLRSRLSWNSVFFFFDDSNYNRVLYYLVLFYLVGKKTDGNNTFQL